MFWDVISSWLSPRIVIKLFFFRFFCVTYASSISLGSFFFLFLTLGNPLFMLLVRWLLTWVNEDHAISICCKIFIVTPFPWFTKGFLFILVRLTWGSASERLPVECIGRKQAGRFSTLHNVIEREILWHQSEVFSLFHSSASLELFYSPAPNSAPVLDCCVGLEWSLIPVSFL